VTIRVTGLDRIVVVHHTEVTVMHCDREHPPRHIQKILEDVLSKYALSRDSTGQTAALHRTTRPNTSPIYSKNPIGEEGFDAFWQAY